MLTRLRSWWLRRRLAGAVLAKLVDGTGVTSAEWPARTAKETILQWFDEQLASSRTPYGVSGSKILIFRTRVPGPPWKEWFLIERRAWWLSVRDEVAFALEGLLPQEDVMTAVAAVGTALDAAWKDAGR